VNLFTSAAEGVVLRSYIVLGLEKDMVSLARVASELVVTDIAEGVIQSWKTIFTEAWIVHEKVQPTLLHYI